MKKVGNYSVTSAHGVFPMSNWGGLEITGTTVKWHQLALVARFNFGTPEKETVHIIQTPPSGRSFIRKAGKRFYLDQIQIAR